MKKRILLVISLFLIFVTLFSACAGDNEDTDTSTSTNADTSTETASDKQTENEEEKSPATLVAIKDKSFIGNITFYITLDDVQGEYSLELADGEKNVLPYFSKIASGMIAEGETSVLVENFVFPKACKYIKMTVENEEYFLKIPQEYTINSTNEFRFGAFSDVHYNRGNFFNSALDFLDEQSIDFVAVAGDLTDDGELEYLESFNNAIKDREYKVYTTSGNHDAKAIKDGSWLENINTQATNDSEVVDKAPNGLDFVYKPDGLGGDVFVFLAQVRWRYPTIVNDEEYTLLDKSQLEWLAGVLEKYKDNTVFLFFHTFLSSPDGDEADAVGNILNPGGYSYDLPFKYGTADEAEFRSLLKKYKNVVFFSGHSHWMFEMEIYNENANISNFNGEYCHMVHIPSVSEPRWIGNEDTSRTSKTGEASEGWIVEVYDEAIVFIPVDFISETYYTEYIKIIPLE